MPCSDVLGLFRNGPPELRSHLPGINPEFEQVIKERQEGRKREGRHEEGDEPKLDHCTGKKAYEDNEGKMEPYPEIKLVRTINPRWNPTPKSK